MTRAQAEALVRARRFTYATAVYKGKAEQFRHFVVLTGEKEQARRRALVYIRARWGEAPDELWLYPQTYMREAMIAVRKGQHDRAGA